MALLVISLLLLSTAFLSEAIDSVGTVPELKLGSQKRKPKIPGVSPNCGFGRSCGVEGFFNETEDEALLSVLGSTGTNYLRAVVFGRYEGGVWAPHESVREAYSGETMPPWVLSYSDRIEKDVGIRPLVEVRGYVPAVLNLRRIDSEAPLEYDGDLRIFFSGTPFTTGYSLSYDVYTYGEGLLESAKVVDDPSNLEIPEVFTGWLREIADEAAGDATTPYGRIKNVISYLKANYSYNLEYPPAPTGVDPVEWFLTGSREGVCTHFNSALVLLARSLGIPARLAGGYLIQPEADAQLVYAKQRHAFSEIPFEDLGWMIFDATPAAGCSECEGVEGDGEVPGEEERADTCSPTDSVFNQTECEDCVCNCTRLSPEGGAGPDVDLFEIRGVTGSDYLRTMVGERYDGLWNLIRPDPQPYGGGPISYQVSGYAGDLTYAFTISPLKEMGGFIPSALYTNELRLDAEVERYQDQLIFFSTEVFREPYSLSITRYEFDYWVIDGAVTVSDPRYLNVPEDLLDRFRSIALDATSAAESPHEKLKALEAFLRSNYEYDPDYTRAPEGVDPVEWFLFHEKRGLCANFNSAFVLLARSIGLPARLVVGYAVDPGAEWQIVNANQTHAYSEALFEGIGWMTFDATSSADGPGDVEGQDGEELEPVEEVFNQTECEDCVCNCTKMDPEGGTLPEVDLFQVFGVAGTAYLRTMVGESYDGTWGMIEPSSETYENEVISHRVSGYASAQVRRFMVAPMVDMGGFIPSTLYVNELDLGWPLQRYPEHHVFFSDRRFNTSYIVTYTHYDYDPETLKAASPTEDPRYLGVPPELITEIKALALVATSGAESPYEQLRALETFLQSNYEYYVNYTRAPEGVDPVEWFLFHEGRGVCANFNSAFVLLARSLGLPARYVGGYLIDPSAEIQNVTSLQAHGYSEVPFKGLGWVTFDATGLGPVQKDVDEEEVQIIGTSTEITGQDAFGVKGLTINVVGRVLDENGDAVDGLRTLVYLKEDKAEEGLLCGEGPVVGGLFNVTGSLPLNITTGDYLIEAHTLGDDRYNGSWSDPPLKVVSKTDFVLAMPEKVIAGRPFAFQGNLTEYKTGIPLSNVTCTVEIGSEEAQLETDNRGFFEGVRTLTEPGNYTLSLEWPGSEYYLGTTTYSSVRIVPLTVTPDKNEMMVRREEALITGRAHAEELPGVGEEVVVSMEGQDIGTATTDEDGRFTLSYEVPRTQELGEVQIGYRLKSSSYSTAQQSAVYARTQIELDAPSPVRVKNQFNMDVTLRDDLGYPIGEAELTIEEEGEEQGKTVKTGSDGTKEVSLRVQEMPGDESVTYKVSFGGEGYYLESTADVSLRVTGPVGLPKMDVIKTVTSVLIFSVLCLVGYTAYIIIQKRLRKTDEYEPEEDQIAPDEPVPKKPAVGIIRLDDRFLFEFPQITEPFPLVWGLGEELVLRMGLARGEGAFGGTVGVLLIVDGAKGPSYDLSIDGSMDHPMTFDEKGYHRVEVMFDSAGARETACEAVIKIVDYREEVNDLFNEEFEEYEGLREEIKTHFTAREFMHSILRGLSDRFSAPLNEMVGIFEIAGYSLHEIRRSEYERFYAARHEFEEMKVGD